MAAMNIAVDLPVNPRFNVDKFKHRVQDYASMLVLLMSKESESLEMETVTRDTNNAEALAFIQSLAVKGGENIPSEIDSIDCFIEEKYER